MLRVNSLIIAIIFSISFHAQEVDSSSRYKPSFGFNIGLNRSLLFNSNATDELQITNGFGFRLGVISSFPIGRKWSIDPKAELSFNNGKVTENKVTYQVDPNNLDFMTHIKHNFNGFEKNFKPFSYFGPSLRVPVSGEIMKSVYSTRTTLSLDFATGVDIDFKNFIISPELRFSAGIMDIRQNPTGKMLRGTNAAFVVCFTGK